MVRCRESRKKRLQARDLEPTVLHRSSLHMHVLVVQVHVVNRLLESELSGSWRSIRK
jgi:hypothetical protein